MEKRWRRVGRRERVGRELVGRKELVGGESN